MSKAPWDSGGANHEKNYDQNANAQFLSNNMQLDSTHNYHQFNSPYPSDAFHSGWEQNNARQLQESSLPAIPFFPQDGGQHSASQPVPQFHPTSVGDMQNLPHSSYTQAPSEEYNHSYDQNYFHSNSAYYNNDVSYWQGHQNQQKFYQPQGLYTGFDEGEEYCRQYEVQQPVHNDGFPTEGTSEHLPPVGVGENLLSISFGEEEAGGKVEEASKLENIPSNEAITAQQQMVPDYSEKESRGLETSHLSDHLAYPPTAVFQVAAANTNQGLLATSTCLPPVGTMTGTPTGNQFRKVPLKKSSYFNKGNDSFVSFTGNMEPFPAEQNLLVPTGAGDHIDLVVDSSSVATEEYLDQKLADSEVALYNQSSLSPSLNLDPTSSSQTLEPSSDKALPVDPVVEEAPLEVVPPVDRDAKKTEAKSIEELETSPPVDEVKTNPSNSTDSSNLYNPLHYLSRKKPNRDSTLSPATTLWEILDVSSLKLGPKLVPAQESEFAPSTGESGDSVGSAVSLLQNTGTGPSKNNLLSEGSHHSSELNTSSSSSLNVSLAERQLSLLVQPEIAGQDLNSTFPVLLPSAVASHTSTFQLVGDKPRHVPFMASPGDNPGSTPKMASVPHHEFTPQQLEQQQPIQQHQEQHSSHNVHLLLPQHQSPSQQPQQHQLSQQRFQQQKSVESDLLALESNTVLSGPQQISDPHHSAFTSVKSSHQTNHPPASHSHNQLIDEVLSTLNPEPVPKSHPPSDSLRVFNYSSLNPDPPVDPKCSSATSFKQGSDARDRYPPSEGKREVRPHDGRVEHSEGYRRNEDQPMSRQGEDRHPMERSLSKHNYPDESSSQRPTSHPLCLEDAPRQRYPYGDKSYDRPSSRQGYPPDVRPSSRQGYPPDVRPSSRPGDSRPSSRQDYYRNEYPEERRHGYPAEPRYRGTNLSSQSLGDFDRPRSRYSVYDERDRPSSRQGPREASRKSSMISQGYDDRSQYNDDDRQRYSEDRQRYPDERSRYSNDQYRHTDNRSRCLDDQSQYSDDRSMHQDDRSKHQDDRSKHTDDRSMHQDDRSKHQDDRSMHQDDRSKHQDDRSMHQDDRSMHQDDRSMHQDDRSKHSDGRSRHTDERARHTDDRSRYQDDGNRYPDEKSRYSDDQSRYQDERSRYAEDRSRYPEDRSRYPDIRSRSRQGQLSEGYSRTRTRDEYERSYGEAYERPRSRQDDMQHSSYGWDKKDWKEAAKYYYWWQQYYSGVPSYYPNSQYPNASYDPNYNYFASHGQQPPAEIDPIQGLYNYADPFNKGFQDEMASYGQAPPMDPSLGRGPDAARSSSRASSTNFNPLTAADQFARDSQGGSRPSSQLSGFVPCAQEKRRLTPFKYNLPHVRASFTQSGQLIQTMPSDPSEGQPAYVRILSLCDPNSKEVREIRKYPGPLNNQVHKQVVMDFCRQISLKCKDDLDLVDRSSVQLVWDFLALLVKQNGSLTGIDIAELLLQGTYLNSTYENNTADDDQNSTLRTVFDRSLMTGEEEPQQRDDQSDDSTKVKVIDRFRELLFYGRKQDALECAMEQNLWSHAFHLASKMDTKTLASVVTRFENTFIKVNDPLHTLFQVMAGRQPVSVTLIDEKWGDWRPHLSMILSNPTLKPDLDKKNIITLGDTLASRGLLYASHFCYLVGRADFGKYNVKSSKLVLVGSNHTLPFKHFATNLAVWTTEIYEYAMSLADANFTLTSLVPYKFIYITRLIDLGMFEKALKYVEVVAQSIIKNPGIYPPTIIKFVNHLSTTLKPWDPQRNSLLRLDGEVEQDPPWCVNLQAVTKMVEGGIIQFRGDRMSPQIPSTGASSEVGEILMGGHQHGGEDPSSNQWISTSYHSYNQTGNWSDSNLASQWTTNQQPTGVAIDGTNTTGEPQQQQQQQQQQQHQQQQQQGFAQPIYGTSSYSNVEGIYNPYGNNVPMMPQQQHQKENVASTFPPTSQQQQQQQQHTSFIVGGGEMGKIPEETAQDLQFMHHHRQAQEFRRRSRDRTTSTGSNASRRSSGVAPATPGKTEDASIFQFGIPPVISTSTMDSDNTNSMSGMTQPLGAHNPPSDQPKKKQPFPNDDADDFDSVDNKIYKKKNKKENDGGRWWSFFTRNKPKEMDLPDDTKPKIVWDDDKKCWIDKEAGENGGSGKDVSPPPKDIHTPIPGINESGGGGGNRFARGGIPRGLRDRYVDVLGGSTRPAPLASSSLLSVLPKSASMPASIFVPAAIPASEDQDGATDLSQQPQQEQQPEQVQHPQAQHVENHFQHQQPPQHYGYQQQQMPQQRQQQQPQQQYHNRQQHYQQQPPPPHQQPQQQPPQQQPPQQQPPQQQPPQQQPAAANVAGADQQEPAASPQFFNPSQIRGSFQHHGQQPARYGYRRGQPM